MSLILSNISTITGQGNCSTARAYTSNFAGQIDEVKVAKGTWLPETGFAVPTAPYVS